MPRRSKRRRGSSVGSSTLAEGVVPSIAHLVPGGQPSGGAASTTDVELQDLARIAPAALATVLEAIRSPAFIVSVPDTVLRANSRGRELLTSSPEGVLALLRDASSAPASGVPVRIPVKDAPGHLLVILHDREADARSRLAALTPRWGLTPRQAGVLALVAQGESNRSVAGQLGCSEKTVELHVSALLAKTRCSSRSQLVARFWTDPG
jgi:DNA-binding CsgD family transcriptional regulator